MTADNLKIWNALGKTDPAATKAFKRGGGFSGTAVKPIWIVKMLTEQFGPAGVGWGVNEPKFDVVTGGDGDVLVYCTVSAWHGDKANVLWGVGGDKVAGKNKNGLFTDDEAFKKAFTDAVGNAFKSLGVAADIHMGLFDDDKYVSQARAEFAADGQKPDPTPKISPADQALLDGIDLCESLKELNDWLTANEGAALASPNSVGITGAWNARKKGLAARRLAGAG